MALANLPPLFYEPIKHHHAHNKETGPKANMSTNNETIDLAPQFSFKPIETEDGSELEQSPSDDCSVVEADMLPHEIFRESVDSEMGEESSQQQPDEDSPMPAVRKANPVRETRHTTEGRTSQLISPYPYAPSATTSTEEMPERNDWMVGWSLKFSTEEAMTANSQP